MTVTALGARHIAVEGPIGIGKTSLVERLAARFEGVKILEDVTNPFLSDFYRGRAGAAFQVQLYFLLSRHQQHVEIAQRDLFTRLIVADYTMPKDRIFARMNLNDEEFRLYDRLYQLLTVQLPRPDLVIYLEGSVDTCLRRIRIRGREFERSMDPDYLRRLKDEYSGVEPFPVAELWEYLAGRDVTPEEITLLQKTQAPRTRTPKEKPQIDPFQLASMIGTASGKPYLYGLPDDWKYTKPADVELMTKNAKMWVKAFEKLKSYTVAEKVHHQITHKILVRVKGTGTEEASWKSGNVMVLNLSRPIVSVAMGIEILVHELGHAFEELFELSELINVYGPEHLPCITDYAKRNVWEDFAETFLYYSMHPSELKRKVPAKYEDMGRRIKEKLS